MTVLGYQAAQTLGIPAADAGGHQYRVLIGGRLFTVAGILNPLPLAPEIDRSALVGFPVAAALPRLQRASEPDLRPHRRPRDRPGRRAPRAGGRPGGPGRRRVQPALGRADRGARRRRAPTALLLGLGAVALIVGAIGIANVMVIA